MNYIIETRSSQKRKVLEVLALSLIDQLNIGHYKKTLTIKLSNTLHDGMTVRSNKDCISVVINARAKIDNMCRILAHEMVHVKQMACGTLRDCPTTGHVIWNGQVYPDTSNYLELPWEIEALSKQELLMRRAFES